MVGVWQFGWPCRYGKLRTGSHSPAHLSVGYTPMEIGLHPGVHSRRSSYSFRSSIIIQPPTVTSVAATGMGRCVGQCGGVTSTWAADEGTFVARPTFIYEVPELMHWQTGDQVDSSA